MGYPLRDYSENITHHVISRCVEKKFLLKQGIIKKIFLLVINKAQKKYNFELNYYIIMDNHFHLIIKIIEGGDSLDRIMQYIKSNFARIYNKRCNRTGPFWNERYKTKIIEKADDPKQYLLNTLIYLTNNPVKARIVTNPFQYKWSSFLYYIKKQKSKFLRITIHPLIFSLSSSLNSSLELFKKLTIEYSIKIFNTEWCLAYDFKFRI